MSFEGSRGDVVSEDVGGRLWVGNKKGPLEWWVKNIRQYAVDNKYEPEQVDEYQAIVDFMAARITALGVVGEEWLSLCE